MIGGCSDEGIFYHVCAPTEDDLAKVNQDNSLLLPLEVAKSLTLEERSKQGRVLKELYFGSEDITKADAVKYCLVSHVNNLTLLHFLKS